jgi:TPR repeat protein
MKTSPITVAVILAVACGLAPIPGSAHAGDALPRALSINEAREAYYRGRYGDALALFERLARDHGNAEAAERAGFMLLHGASLYGAAVRRDVPRASELLLQAARAGRPPALFMLDMIEQSD